MDDGRRKMEEIYLEFLRYCLDDKLLLPESTKSIDWMAMMAWAEQQTVVGIIYGGILRAGKALGMPFDALMEWVGYAQQIESRNRQLNKRCRELVEEFRNDGFKSCILKGQGVALYYPNPLLRTSGDIDIWLDGGRDRIAEYVRGKYGEQLERYHHVELPAEDGIEVEVHFTPSYMLAPWSNKRMQRWMREKADGGWLMAELPDGAGEIPVPTAEFNLVFLLSHIYRHLFSEGIGLRQVVDYYYLLRSDVRSKMEDVPSILKYLDLWKFAGALMWVLHEQLGLEEKYLIAEPNEKEGRFLWYEIMIGGNFGQYDRRLGNKEDEGKLRTFVRMTIRNMRYVTHYPAEALCEPVFRIWYFFWRFGV